MIAVSGFDAFGIEALRRGARQFLVKPVSPPLLLAAVADALGGAPLDPGAIQAHERLITQTRRDADVTRGRLLDKVTLHHQAVDASLHRLVAWLAEYFGTVHSLVSIVREGVIDYQIGNIIEDLLYRRGDAYCYDVVHARAPFVINDGLTHPAYREHAMPKSGFRFYAGAPIVTPTHGPVGTLCVVDPIPTPSSPRTWRCLSTSRTASRWRWIRWSSDTRPSAPGMIPSRSVASVWTLIEAELKRAVRRRGYVELAFVELQNADSELRRACAASAYRAAGRRLAVVSEASGLALVVGRAAEGDARERMNQALAAMARRSVKKLQAGVVVVSHDWAPVHNVPALKKLAGLAVDKARGRNDSAIERVALGCEATESVSAT